jgi:hypothetical protein
MKQNSLDKTFFCQVREAAQISRTHSKRQMLGQLLEVRHELSKIKPPENLVEMLRLQNPESVRLDAEKPGAPKLQVVIDDGPNAGMTITTCALEADARLIVEMWNWQRTLTPHKE